MFARNTMPASLRRSRGTQGCRTIRRRAMASTVRWPAPARGCRLRSGGDRGATLPPDTYRSRPSHPAWRPGDAAPLCEGRGRPLRCPALRVVNEPLGRIRRLVFPTGIGAIKNLIPRLGPTLAPRERSSTCHADFGRQVALAAHRGHVSLSCAGWIVHRQPQ